MNEGLPERGHYKVSESFQVLLDQSSGPVSEPEIKIFYPPKNKLTNNNKKWSVCLYP